MQRVDHDSLFPGDGFHRHRAFLESGSKNKPGSSHRPRKFHRSVAKQVLDCLDAEIQTMTFLPGLVHFQCDAKLDIWRDSNWHHWPHLYLCGDQGPDNIAGQNALEYKWWCNTDFMPDTSGSTRLDPGSTQGRVGVGSGSR